MTDPRVPRVRLPLIGTFNPKVSRIYNSLKGSIRFYKWGFTNYDYIVSRIERIWPVRNRLIKEKMGKLTWNEWNKEEKREELLNLYKNEQEKKRESKEEVYGSSNRREKSHSLFREVSRRLQKKDSK
jgi:hypothetical protein